METKTFSNINRKELSISPHNKSDIKKGKEEKVIARGKEEVEREIRSLFVCPPKTYNVM